MEKLKVITPQLTVYKSISFSLAFLLFALCFLFLSRPLFAQTAFSSTANSYTPTATNQYFPQTSPQTASIAIFNFSHAISCILIGQSPIAPCLEYKMYQNAQGVVRSVPYLSNINANNGLLGMTFSMVDGVISTPPIRSSEFLSNLKEQVGIKSANAQVGGSGSGVLSPIFKLWEVSRNIAYLVMILIFVLVGLMVMFRQKLNPQTVVSIQMALPGLVIGLVMITFSYFLASLISDIAFVGTNIVGYYFALAQGDASPLHPPLVPAAGAEQNVLNVFSRYVGILNQGNINEMLSAVWEDLGSDVTNWLRIVAGSLVTTTANNYTQAAQLIPRYGQGIQIGANIAAFFTGALAPTWSTALLLAWVAWFILLYSMFRLLLRLINSLLSIIFLTIASPFIFLASSIPGRQALATSWFFNMLCNVLAFPSVVAVFYFVAFLLKKTNDPAFAISATTTIVGNAAFPLLGGMRLDFLNILIAFGALVALPSIPDVICRAVGRPGQLGGIVAGAISGGVSSGQRYSAQSQQGAGQLASRAQGLADRPGWTRLTTKADATAIGREEDWDSGRLKAGDAVPTYRAGFGATIGGGAKVTRIFRDLWGSRATGAGGTGGEAEAGGGSEPSGRGAPRRGEGGGHA